MVARSNTARDFGRFPKCRIVLAGGFFSLSAIAASALLLFSAISASAAEPPSKTGNSGTGQISFNIPAQSLTTALTAFAEQSGKRLVYPATMTKDLNSAGVRGKLTPEQALDRILAGTGMTYRFTDPYTVTLEALPPGSAKNAMVLPTLKVQAKNEVPAEIETGGPVKGYVATHDFAAEKTNAPILDIPQSISVVTQEQMQQQNPQTLTEALQYTTGVSSYYQTTTDSDTALSIRGFVPVTFLDGMQTSTFMSEPFGLDRIEVLKGPSSVLYGQNVPGGVFDLVSKRPTPYRLDFFQLQGGSFGQVQGAFDLGGPVDQGGTLLYRLTGLFRSSDTQQGFTPNDRIFIAPAFTWHPTDRTTFTFLSHYQRDEVTYPSGDPAQGTLEYNPYGRIPTSLNISGPNQNWLIQDYAVGYLLEHRLNDIFTVRQNFRYEGTTRDENSVTSTGFATDPVTNLPILSTVDRSSSSRDDSNTNITLDTQMAAQFATGPLKHTFIFGVDYWQFTSDDKRGSGSASPLNLFNPVFLPVTTPPYTRFMDSLDDEVGIYFQDQFKWDRFVLLVSGRQDWAYNGTDNKTASTHTGQDSSALTGRAGLLYQFDMGLAPYVSWATSFLPNEGTDFAGNQFSPTTGEQEELGVKYQPPDTNNLLTLSLYNIMEQNVVTPDPVHPGYSLTTGEVRSRGVEIQDVASLAWGLNLIVGYTYLDLTNVKTNDPTEGNTPYGYPKHAGSIWLFETLQHGPLAGLGFGGGVRYIGSNWDYTNTIEVPNVTLVDAALSYQWKKLRLTLNATNILNKRYVSACYNSLNCYYGTQANVIGGASYSF